MLRAKDNSRQHRHTAPSVSSTVLEEVTHCGRDSLYDRMTMRYPVPDLSLPLRKWLVPRNGPPPTRLAAIYAGERSTTVQSQRGANNPSRRGGGLRERPPSLGQGVWTATEAGTVDRAAHTNGLYADFAIGGRCSLIESVLPPVRHGCDRSAQPRGGALDVHTPGSGAKPADSTQQLQLTPTAELSQRRRITVHNMDHALQLGWGRIATYYGEPPQPLTVW